MRHAGNRPRNCSFVRKSKLSKYKKSFTQRRPDNGPFFYISEMETVRLSSEALLARYSKIPQVAIVDLVEAVPAPSLALKIVG